MNYRANMSESYLLPYQMWSLFHAPTLLASGHMASSLSLIEMQGNGQRWGEKTARGSSGVLRDMCRLES